VFAIGVFIFYYCAIFVDADPPDHCISQILSEPARSQPWIVRIEDLREPADNVILVLVTAPISFADSQLRALLLVLPAPVIERLYLVGGIH
jgi:hypothetical protein